MSSKSLTYLSTQHCPMPPLSTMSPSLHHLQSTHTDIPLQWQFSPVASLTLFLRVFWKITYEDNWVFCRTETFPVTQPTVSKQLKGLTITRKNHLLASTLLYSPNNSRGGYHAPLVPALQLVSCTLWVLSPIWHKTGNFWDVISRQTLGLVLKKINLTQQQQTTQEQHYLS